MKKTILVVSAAALIVGGLAAVARQKKSEPLDPSLAYNKFRKKCTAYVERNRDKTSPYKKYYIGECVFQFDFHANTDKPVNLIPLYKKYADTPKHYPHFDPKKCTVNLKKKKFNFSRWHPQWHKIPGNQIDVKKVKDDDGNKFSFTATIDDSYDDGTSKHIITAEMVCIGPSMRDVKKHEKKLQKQAAKKASGATN